MRQSLPGRSTLSSVTPKRLWLTACIASTTACALVLPAAAGSSMAAGAMAAPGPGAAATAVPAADATAQGTPSTSVTVTVGQAAATAAVAATELTAASTAFAAADAAVMSTATVRTQAEATFQSARAELSTAADRADAAHHREAATEQTYELLSAGALRAIDPVTVVESGLSLTDQIDPAVDPVEEIDEAEIRAERAELVSDQRDEDLVVARDQQAAARLSLTNAATAQESAALALTAARDRQVQATEVKTAADQVLVAAQKTEQEAEVARARAEAAALAARSMERPAIAGITSPYGMRTHPITGVYKLHSGTDFSVGDGIARAARAGTVSAVTQDGAYGNMVTISHGTIDGDTVETRYAHLSAATVSVGASVAAGDQVGRIGSTGYATGPHLHFEVLVNGEFVDPMTWLS